MDDITIEALAKKSDREDTVEIVMVYRQKFVQFDIAFMQAKYLPAEELFRRYFSDAFAAVDVPVANLGETHQLAVASSSETHT